MLEKIAGNDLARVELANSLRGLLGGLSPEESDKYFAKYLQTAKNVLDLLYGLDEQLQLLAIAAIRLYYSNERYMASELITFISCMSARKINTCSIFFNQENNVPEIMKMAFCCLQHMESSQVDEFLSALCFQGEYEGRKYEIQYRELAVHILVRRFQNLGLDNDALLRHETIQSLLGAMKACPEFIPQKRIKDVDDPLGIYRRGLLDAFGEIKGEQVTEAYIYSAVHDPQECLRGLACEILGKREEEVATQALIEITNKEYFMSVQVAATKSLFSRRDILALEFFQAEIFAKADYRYPLQFVLDGLKDFCSEWFVRFLLREVQNSDGNDTRERERVIICEILPALAENKDFSQREDLQEEIARVLWNVQKNDPDSNVRDYATAAIVQMFGVEALKEILLAQ